MTAVYTEAATVTALRLFKTEQLASTVPTPLPPPPPTIGTNKGRFVFYVSTSTPREPGPTTSWKSVSFDVTRLLSQDSIQKLAFDKLLMSKEFEKITCGHLAKEISQGLLARFYFTSQTLLGPNAPNITILVEIDRTLVLERSFPINPALSAAANDDQLSEGQNLETLPQTRYTGRNEPYLSFYIDINAPMASIANNSNEEQEQGPLLVHIADDWSSEQAMPPVIALPANNSNVEQEQAGTLIAPTVDDWNEEQEREPDYLSDEVPDLIDNDEENEDTEDQEDVNYDLNVMDFAIRTGGLWSAVELLTIADDSKQYTEVTALDSLREGGEDGHCSICLQGFTATMEVVKTPCSHVFHRGCIAQWLAKNNSCPMCRHTCLATVS